MSEYRFLPQVSPGVWWKILLAVGIVLGVPMVVNASLPDTALQRLRPLELSDPYYDWSVPVFRDNGQPWMCTRQDSLTLGYEFDCATATVSTRMVSGIEDMEVALLRELRANRLEPGLSENYVWDRESSTESAILADRETGDVVLATVCPAEKCEGSYLFAYFQDTGDSTLLRDSWRQLTHNLLPPQVSETLNWSSLSPYSGTMSHKGSGLQTV